MDIVSEKWEQILQNFYSEYEVSDIAFKTWILPLKIVKVQGNVLSLLVPNGRTAIEILEKKYILQLKVAIAEETGQEFELSFLTPEDLEEIPKDNPPEEEDIAQSGKLPPDVMDKLIEANLNPKYTFDTFVVGSNNRLAHAAAVAVAESPGSVYNPLFIYGGAGLGKTHLMHSIAHYIIKTQPNKTVRYVSSEIFTNELIAALRNGSNISLINDFRNRYRNVDALLIDDIQFIIGKESTQEEFFHTFNELVGHNKQIIISSDRPPKEFETLDQRLKTRFAMGLLADVQMPDYETRMAILQKKAELEGYRNIQNDVFEYVATNIKSNIRELEGALNKIIAYSRLLPNRNQPVTVEFAAESLKDVISPDEKKPLTAELIIDTVAEHFNISTADLRGKKRNADIAQPRQIAMYLCRDMIDGISYDTIGKALNRDHSTVMHGIDRVQNDIDLHPDMKQTVDVLKKKIKPGL